MFKFYAFSFNYTVSLTCPPSALGRRSSCEEMARTGFEALSQLVLVDILAALPMEHVVRVARLGHQRLRQTCSLKWVTDRMSDVSFEKAVHTHQTAPEMRPVFCTDSIVKRLRGRVVIRVDLLKLKAYRDACVELANKVVGKWLLFMTDPKTSPHRERSENLSSFIESLKSRNNIIYTVLSCYSIYNIGARTNLPCLIFEYSYDNLNDEMAIYRPSRLNERHIIDVIRAVWPKSPLDILGRGRRRLE